MIVKKILYIPLVILSILFALCFVYCFKTDTSQTDTSIFIWQNYTSSYETLVSVLLPKDKEVAYFVENKQISPSFQKVLDKWKIHHLSIKNLKLDKNYKLFIKDQSLNKSYTKKFNTLDWEQNSFTIAVASCMDDHWDAKQIKNMWSSLLSFKPDMIFLIGDNVYADSNANNRDVQNDTPQNLERRYIETFTALPIYQISSLIPILAVWDDHDYGMGNGHGGFKHKPFVTKLFRDFFPLPENSKHLQKGPGISFRIQTKNQNLFFMDGRSGRSASSGGSLWGALQEEWFFKNFYQRPLNWIVSGGQFFGKHHRFESFEKDFKENFKKVKNKIIKSKKETFIISGDRHLSELLKSLPSEHLKSPPIYEFTTSPIHAKIYKEAEKFKKTGRHIHYVPNKLNFGIIRHQIEGKKIATEVELYGLDKALFFSEKIY